MNVIERAIYTGRHLEYPGEYRWKDFKRAVKGKRLFVFGTSEACGYFLSLYGDKYEIEGFLDNDSRKDGRIFAKDIRISNPGILERIGSEAVVLITNTNHYHAIIQQLAAMGIDNYYVLCKMEAHKPDFVLLEYAGRAARHLQGRYYLFRRLQKQNFQRYLLYVKAAHNPIRKDKIVFFSKGAFRDHGKYITLKLLEKKINCDIVWIMNRNHEELPAGIRTVCMEDTERVIYEMATAHIWFNDNSFPIYTRKRRKQIFIFTKHWSSITLKKFYLDTDIYFRFRPWEKSFIKNFAKSIDYIITGSEFDKRTCRSGLAYRKRFLEFGSPRTDILFDSPCPGLRVKEHFSVSQDKKLLLFAPTFRLKGGEDGLAAFFLPQIPDFGRLRQALEGGLGGEWVILFKLHPLVAHQSGAVSLTEEVIDASLYEDTQELLAASDAVISDYSSLLFEPAMAGKPVFIFAPDSAEYVEKERELWLDLKELPFDMARTDEELAAEIIEFEEMRYRERVQRFFGKYGVHEDGCACERTVDFVRKLMYK